MKNPNPINLQTSEELREKGWQAESRDADGHLISCHAPIDADDPGIAEWIVECTRNGETVTFWPSDAAAPTPQNQTAGSILSGWKIVPEEPTEEMIEAGFLTYAAATGQTQWIARACWKAMLSASPQPVDGEPVNIGDNGDKSE